MGQHTRRSGPGGRTDRGGVSGGGGVARRARGLAARARAAREPGTCTPVVLAGNVIGPDSPVGVALRELLAGETDVLSPRTARWAPRGWPRWRPFGPDAPRPTAP